MVKQTVTYGSAFLIFMISILIFRMINRIFNIFIGKEREGTKVDGILLKKEELYD